MKSATQRFSNVVKQGVSPILKENGFKKKGLNYYRPNDEIGHVVNIQRDKWNTKDEIKFTINLGIFHAKYWLSEFDFKNTKVIPKFPKERGCVIRERIGELKYGKDFWYSIESQRLEWKLIDELKEDLEGYIVPFFENINSKQKLINYFKNNQRDFGNDVRLFLILAEENLMMEAQEVYCRLCKDCNEQQFKYLIEKGKKYKLKKYG